MASGFGVKGFRGAVTSATAPRATAIAATVAPALRSWDVAATPASASASASAAAAAPGWAAAPVRAVLIRAAAVPRPPLVQGMSKVPRLHMSSRMAKFADVNQRTLIRI